MMKQAKVKIVGTGAYLPGKQHNIDKIDRILGELSEAPTKIQKWLKMNKSLMRQMLDIDHYHFAIDPLTREFTDDNISMSVKAATKAIKMAGINTGEVDFIAYGSPHQDQMPTASVRIQEELGIEQCGEVSIHANCTSAYKALLIAHDMLKSGRFKTALVVSSNMSSSELRAEYYNQALVKKEEVLLRYFLSDGAGALVLQSTEDKHGLFVEQTFMESIGGKKPAAMFNKRPAYWMNPKEEFELGLHHLAQVFNDQLRLHFNEVDGSVFYKGLKRMMEKYPFKTKDVRFFQVNFPSKHIAEMVIEECELLGIPKEKLYTKMNTMGYVGPPMAFLCIDRMMEEETFQSGDLILSFVTEVSKFMQAGYLLKYE
jgi:3-oxoacyl-[acyl-carrier-protein] synthase III